MSSTESGPWWRSAVIYQIYPRSFADANGDGIGDLKGIQSRLSYVAQLGVDAVWLSPFYKSPQADAGYDVADYRDVDPLFGTLDDFDEMLSEAHERGLRVIVDLVPNHTSVAHQWFREALASPPGSAERARYLFRDGRGEHGELPPTNWLSQFGGSAWTRLDDGQWYLHLFAPAQPDLDWTNHEVIEEFHSILRFWLDRGVDGFRIDVAHGLAKDPAMPDYAQDYADGRAARHQLHHPHWDQDAVHEIYRGWRRVLDSYEGERTSVAEAWVEQPDRLALYLRPDELHTAFNFEFLQAAWDADAMRSVIDSTTGALRNVGAPATWVLSNHDVVRHVTRYGGGELGQRRARAATLLMLALPGGAYVYQGEELGLEEVLDIPDDLLQDPTFVQTQGRERGRDGCRVPLPWSGDEPPFGFGPGGTPWLPQPSRWESLTADKQADDFSSMLHFYRSALQLRHELPGLGDGPFEWLQSEPGTIAFSREGRFVCVTNFNEETHALAPELQGAEILLASGSPVDDRAVAGNSTVWLRLS